MFKYSIPYTSNQIKISPKIGFFKFLKNLKMVRLSLKSSCK